MTLEEQAEKLLTIDQNLLDKFLNDHVDTVRILHNWVLARTEVLDIESINIMYQFFNKFLVQAKMMIAQENKAMQRPPS